MQPKIPILSYSYFRPTKLLMYLSLTEAGRGAVSWNLPRTFPFPWLFLALAEGKVGRGQVRCEKSGVGQGGFATHRRAGVLLLCGFFLYIFSRADANKGHAGWGIGERFWFWFWFWFEWMGMRHDEAGGLALETNMLGVWRLEFVMVQGIWGKKGSRGLTQGIVGSWLGSIEALIVEAGKKAVSLAAKWDIGIVR